MYHTIEQITENLQAAGCSEECIQEFLAQYECGCQSKCDRLLSRQRRELLENLHQEQRKIDCLDYLVYQMKKNERK